MRKSLLIVTLITFTALAARPSQAFFEANISGGYTTLNMADFNDFLKTDGTVSHSPVNGGFYVAVDAGISVFPFIKLVPRLTYVQASTGRFKSSGYEANFDNNLISPELGLTSDVSLPLTGLSVRGGLFGGYGVATSMWSYKNPFNVTLTNLYQGNGFVGEALAAIRYELMPFTSLSLETGYRMANIAQMSNNTGTWKGANGDLALDFSGVNVGLGLSVGF